ncbi:hypothetical protein B0H19DRAFT_1103917 [Mycena capillaripes]|nr:hypothetical protein B0H19DRAFT_1103917 [Mycena capillaripes]
MAVPFALPMHLFPLAFTRGRISTIDSEISALKESLEKLKLERKILRGHLASYIYPVLTLPNEIVSEIFLQTLDPSGSSLSGPSSPLFLGHICQKWRDIALSTPSLWTTISLTITDRPSPAERRLRLLETWLIRSCQCPLSISITDKTQLFAFGLRFFDAIVPHQRRWQTLRLKMPYSIISRIQNELPSLRDLQICPLRPPTNDPSLIFSGAPKLKIVTLKGSYNAKFKLPWEQLTSLSLLEGGFLDEIVQILRKTPHLSHLAAQPAQPSWIGAGSEIMEVPLLQHRLLNALTLPALNHLDVSEPIIPAVVDLIMRSRCPLNALHTIIVARTEYCPLLSSEGKVSLVNSVDESHEA